ncbi:MAG: hypothetical protein KIS78_11120 [Labilithrix sp.]|nr:hypothetical protein [Labilithrix sp.]
MPRDSSRFSRGGVASTMTSLSYAAARPSWQVSSGHAARPGRRRSDLEGALFGLRPVDTTDTVENGQRRVEKCGDVGARLRTRDAIRSPHVVTEERVEG